MAALLNTLLSFNTQKNQNAIGIANINSRVTASNGIAEFDSQQGHGCILSAIFPVTAELRCKKDRRAKTTGNNYLFYTVMLIAYFYSTKVLGLLFYALQSYQKK